MCVREYRVMDIPVLAIKKFQFLNISRFYLSVDMYMLNVTAFAS